MKLYRSKDGLFMGVCQGVANQFDISVFWLRLLVLFLALSTGFWPVFLVYVFIGLLLKTEPLYSESDLYQQNQLQELEQLIQRGKKLGERLNKLELEAK